MSDGEREFPDEPTGPFPTPPREAVDDDGRTIRYRAVGSGLDRETARSDLAVMYRAFDPADRAQGIPPSTTSAIESWLDAILTEDARNVVAAADATDAAVGHATLVSDGEAHELAIFVLQAYQGAGVGTELLRTALGHGAATGVDRVWLTVERWNGPAVSLYRKTGFETADAGSFELEMCLRLASSQTESTG
jgi:ribosomal protein S18 acetylase RimI-like enzyme